MLIRGFKVGMEAVTLQGPTGVLGFVTGWGPVLENFPSQSFPGACGF